MYLSLSDKPSAEQSGARAAAEGRPRVARVVVLLGIVSLLTDISSEAVAAILPLYLVTVVGLSPAAYGFLDGLNQGASALVRIASGWAADRGGHPKWVALAGYGLSAGARIGLLVVNGFGAIMAVVAIDRIGKGIRTAPRDAMISAAAHADHVGHAFAVHRTLDTIGAALGPLIAFAVLWAIPDGYTTVMVVSVAFALIGLALLGLVVPDARTRGRSVLVGRQVDDAVAATPAFAWRRVVDRGLLRLLVVAGVLGLVTIGDGFIYLALLDRGGFAATWFPLLYVGTNLAYLLLALPIGRLADRVGRAQTFVAGHLALLATYVVAVLPVDGAVVVVAPLVLLGAFYASTDGMLAAIAGRIARPEVRASAIASAQTVVAVARLVASSAFGLLWFVVGAHLALLVVAALLLALIPAAYVAVRVLDRR